MKIGLNNFIVLNIIFVCSLLFVAYKYRTYKRSQSNKPNESFLDWFNQGDISMKGVIVSFSFGFVFGFIDNLFLWIGTDHLKKFMKGNMLMKEGWSNTYSDFIGATVGTSIAAILKNYLGYDDDNPISTPIWVEALSIPTGCIAGMYTGKFFFSK